MTLFSQLSPEAQSAIVDAILGVHPLPILTDTVREEIRIWAETHEEGAPESPPFPFPPL